MPYLTTEPLIFILKDQNKGVDWMEQKFKDIANFMFAINRIFVKVLYNIEEPDSIELLSITRNYILFTLSKGDINYEDFRNEILKQKPSGYEEEGFLVFNHLSVLNLNLDEISKYLYVLNDAILEIIEQINHSNHVRAYDLVDAIHCLPVALINKNGWFPKQYWRTYIQPYRDKWDNTFLLNKEKEILKRDFWEKIFK